MCTDVCVDVGVWMHVWVGVDMCMCMYVCVWMCAYVWGGCACGGGACVHVYVRVCGLCMHVHGLDVCSSVCHVCAGALRGQERH